MGARDRSHISHPPEGSIGTAATLSDHNSRRSSLGSIGIPDGSGGLTETPAESAPNSRHNLMPGWQQVITVMRLGLMSILDPSPLP